MLLLIILIMPVQSGIAETTLEESEDSESEKIHETQLQEEIITEENTDEDTDDASLETDNNEETHQNESEETETEEEQSDLDENEGPANSNDEELLDEQTSENKEDEESENNEDGEEPNEDSDEESEEIDEEEISETDLLDESNDFSTYQTTGSIHTNRTLTVTTTAQTNENVSLRLVFTGTTTIRDGAIYMHFTFPDSIELSNENIIGLSASNQVTERYNIFGLIVPVERGLNNYSADEIQRIGNTIYLRYNLQVIPFSYIRSDHIFTLNITLNNRAFSLEGTHPYTFQSLGSRSINPPIVNAAQATINLNIPESGSLSLASVPENLYFQTTQIGTTSYVNLANNSNHNVNINDTRNFSNDWTLTAQSLSPLITGNDSRGPLRIGLLDENNSFRNMDEAVLIAQSSENRPDPSNIDLNTLPTGNLVVSVDEFDLFSDVPYTTTIQWTLTDAP